MIKLASTGSSGISTGFQMVFFRLQILIPSDNIIFVGEEIGMKQYTFCCAIDRKFKTQGEVTFTTQR